MDTRFDQFIEAYKSASPELKELIDSGKIGEFAEGIIFLLDKNTDLKPKLIILVSNYVLKVIDEDKLQLQITNLGFSEKETEVLVAKINSFVAGPYTYLNQGSFNESVEAQTEKQVAELTAKQAGNEPTAQPQTTPPSPAPANTPVPVAPSDPSAVAPIRTMEADVDKIHGYGAYRKLYPEAEGEDGVVKATSQADVLAKRPKLSDTPTYSPSAENQNK